MANYYKVVYKDNHGEAYWIGSAFDKYDAISKSKAHPTQVITAELFDDYEKKNPIDKVNVRKEPTESNGWHYRDWETDRKSTRLNSSHRL